MHARSFLGLFLVAVACATPLPPPPAPPPAGITAPPVAERRPHSVFLADGQKREDPYFWLRTREDPAVLGYLKAENAYADSVMGPLEPLRKKLYDEMLARIVEDDSTVPANHGGFAYYHRTEKGKAYPIHCRKKLPAGAEEIILDENAMATGKSFFRIGNLQPGPKDRVLAYSTDEKGDESYTLQFKGLGADGKPIADKIPGTYYSIAWSADERFVFYTVVDAAQRPYLVKRHQIGTATTADIVVHEEKDERYNAMVDLSRDESWVVIHVESAITTESRVIDAKRADGPVRIVEPRKEGVEYYLAPHGDRWFILSNYKAPTFELYEAPAKKPGRAQWKVLIAARPDVTLTGLEPFADHLLIYEREKGLQQVRVRSLGKKAEEHRIAFEEPVYEIWPDLNLEWKSHTFRFVYSSLVTPETVYDYNLDKKTKEQKKRQEIRGYDPTGYMTERLWAKASDGVEVPISIVRKKETPIDGTAPLLLNGYGAYGIPYDPSFTPNWLSMVDRGMIVAIAHIRGGGELGRKWKDDGKLEKKMNTFTDFIACGEHLVAQKYTMPERLAISGRSAGGLSIGAVLNLRPDLWHVAVAGVPFVDVINTMSDVSIPLTAIEWEEWGNPTNPTELPWMLAYSPYDNVAAKNYPAIYVHAGLNDTRVAYWEPAKWVAKLRSTKTDQNKLVLRTNLDAGHGGASGRYAHLEETAFEYAFILDQLGLE